MITQKEIARRLGVSASMVSRALSGSAAGIGAAAKTIERIRAEAARLHYHPSAAALSLRGQPTHTIGVVIKNFDDPFFGHIIAELQTLAATRGYSMLLTGGRTDIQSLAKHRLDGLIIAGSDFMPDGLDVFVRRGIRVVRIGVGPAATGVVNVAVDWEYGFRQLVSHLTKLGHRDIGYLSDETASNLHREKLLQAAMKRASLYARPNSFVRVQTTGAQAGYEAMQTLLQRCGDLMPTAVVAAEDAIAQTALRALFERHLQVPQDLTLVGVDDVPAARMTIPALTTLRQPIPAMVQAAFEQITSNVRHPPMEVSIQPELVVRESSAPPATRRETHDD
jgi:LacI family transcriptional regulator